MLKLRSIFVTSLLTGLVITSNFGCGDGGGNTDASTDTKTDTKDAVGEVKDGGGDADVKADAEVGADADAKADAEVGADADAKADADAGEVKTDADASTDGDASETTIGCPATPACTLGAKVCGTGGVQTCITGANGCPAFSTAVACAAHTECTGAGNCTCIAAPAGCTAAGTFCAADGTLNTCAAAGTCFYLSAGPTTCAAHTSCKGALPGAACTCDNTNCAAAGSSCIDAKNVRACADDGTANHCLVAADSSCGIVDTCQGTAPTAACACPVAGSTAGKGCALGANPICDGTDVLTCVTVSSCNIWQPSTHCAGTAAAPTPGMTCGTKGGPAACQCMDLTGTTVFVAAANGSDTAAGVFPTGLAIPPQCAFQTLTHGLAVVATTNAAANAAVLNKVTALKDATAPTTFNGETFPLAVPAGVSLNTSDASAFVIQFNDGAADPAVSLATLSSISGFTIEADGNPGATAIAFPATGSATVSSVSITKGTSTFTSGVSIGGSATGTLTSVTIDSTSGPSVDISTSSMPTITGGTISNSGAAGINVSSGTVAITNVTLGTNQTGASVSGGTVTIGGTTVIQGSNGAGLALTGGSTTVTGVTIGGAAAAQANGNGITATGTAVNLTVNGGSTIIGNMGDGIVAGDGSILTLSGASDVGKNGQNGVSLHGGAATISDVTIDANLVSGIDIASPNGPAMNIGSAGKVTTITKNTGDGILIHSSQLNTANSVKADTLTITANGGSGVNISGDTGDTFVTFINSTVSGNKSTGIIVAQGAATTTQTVFRSNDINGNNSTHAQTAGGMLFLTSSTLNGFSGNKIHLNQGNQLEFDADPNPLTTWSIQNGACDALANSLYCYGTPSNNGLGLFIKTGVTATVDASFVKWQNNPPAKTQDFNFGIGAGVTVLNSCAAVVDPTCN